MTPVNFYSFLQPVLSGTFSYFKLSIFPHKSTAPAFWANTEGSADHAVRERSGNVPHLIWLFGFWSLSLVPEALPLLSKQKLRGFCMPFEVMNITVMLKEKSHITGGRKSCYCWFEVATDLWIQEGAKHTSWWLELYILTRDNPYRTQQISSCLISTRQLVF